MPHEVRQQNQDLRLKKKKKKYQLSLFPNDRSLDLSGYVPMTVTPSPPQDRPSYVYDLYAVSVSIKSSFQIVGTSDLPRSF